MYTFTPTDWNDDQTPAISAAQLDRIETGVDNAQKELDWFTNGTLEASIASGDIVRIYDASEGEYRTMTRANFVAGLLTSAVAASTYEPIKGATENYVSNAELSVLQATSGSNTGDETVTTIGALINGATGKTTPVDADMVGLMDSAASNVLKKLSWANIKATLKTYFDGLYQPLATVLTNTTASFTTALSANIGTNNAKVGVTTEISEVVEDPTPTLGGDLDAANKTIRDAETVTFDAELDNGNSGATKTIDFGAAQKQKVTLSENCTFTFTPPPNGVANFVLIATNFGNFTPTFPGNVSFVGTSPSWTSSGRDFIGIYYNGTEYLLSVSPIL